MYFCFTIIIDQISWEEYQEVQSKLQEKWIEQQEKPVELNPFHF